IAAAREYRSCAFTVSRRWDSHLKSMAANGAFLMRLLRLIWRILVGVKDALVLLFMLLFFGALYAALAGRRSEEHTSELQSLMRISYAVFCLKKKIIIKLS